MTVEQGMKFFIKIDEFSDEHPNGRNTAFNSSQRLSSRLTPGAENQINNALSYIEFGETCSRQKL